MAKSSTYLNFIPKIDRYSWRINALSLESLGDLRWVSSNQPDFDMTGLLWSKTRINWKN